MAMTPALFDLFQYALNATREAVTDQQEAYSQAHSRWLEESEQLEREADQEIRMVQHALDLGITPAELEEHFGAYYGDVVRANGLTAR